jgi:hypothetical protein
MKNSFPMLVGTATLALAMCPAVSGADSESAAKNGLCIHIYNWAGTPQRSLQWAIVQTARAFTRAGISTSWAWPAADSPEAHRLDLSGVEKSSGRSEQSCLVVTLVKDLPPNQYPDALGIAVPFARFGVNVEIFYSRVERQASAGGVGVDVLLAYTLTHEIGHVLLRSLEHAMVGIMRARWDHDSIRLASSGMMAFLPEQARQMQKAVERFQLQEQRIVGELTSGRRAPLRCFCSSQDCPSVSVLKP